MTCSLLGQGRYFYGVVCGNILGLSYHSLSVLTIRCLEMRPKVVKFKSNLTAYHYILWLDIQHNWSEIQLLGWQHWGVHGISGSSPVARGLCGVCFTSYHSFLLCSSTFPTQSVGCHLGNIILGRCTLLMATPNMPLRTLWQVGTVLPRLLDFTTKTLGCDSPPKRCSVSSEVCPCAVTSCRQRVDIQGAVFDEESLVVSVRELEARAFTRQHKNHLFTAPGTGQRETGISTVGCCPPCVYLVPPHMTIFTYLRIRIMQASKK